MVRNEQLLPLEIANVSRICQLVANRISGPPSAVAGVDAVNVQKVSDAAQGFATRVLVEDASNNGSLGGIAYGQLAIIAANVTVRNAPLPNSPLGNPSLATLDVCG